ncbi:MAG: hypothetical protein ACPGJV_04825, partial [Bacteriovoracaceae bacterium]
MKWVASLIILFLPIFSTLADSSATKKRIEFIDGELKKLSIFNHSIVFFSPSKKINKIIPGFKKHFAGRKIVFCREISKLYEEYIRMNIDELEIFNN